MMNEKSVIILFGLLIILSALQALFGYLQVKNITENYKNLLKEYHEGYFIGVGKIKSKFFGNGCVIFIVINSIGLIIESKILKGRSIFKRMIDYPDPIGRNISEFKNDKDALKSKKTLTMKALEKAIKNIQEYKEKK